MQPKTEYTRSGDLHIAYQVVGQGPLDLVYVPGWVSHVELGWEEPTLARFLNRLASFSRVIVFDKRGTGPRARAPEASILRSTIDALMNKLILGLVAFFGVHSISLLAVGWRNRVAQRLGTRAWQGIYSVASLLGFFLLVSGYRATRASAAVLYVSPPWCRYIAALLMLPAFTLVLASVLPGRIKARVQHPLLLATMLWALAHLLTNGSLTDVLLFGAFLVWSVAVRLSLDRRPARPALGFSGSAANDAIALVAGIALYVAFLLGLHAWWIGVPILGAS